MSKPFRFPSPTLIPGTEFYDYAKKNDLITIDAMTDEDGHQLPNVIYPGPGSRRVGGVGGALLRRIYFRPKAAWRIVRKAIFERRSAAACTRKPPNISLRSKRKKFVADQKAASDKAASAFGRTDA